MYLVRSLAQLFVLYGFIASLGFGGASGVTASVAITHWFHSRRGFAFGILEAGFDAGQLLLVPSTLVLIGTWGWQIAVLLLGGLLCAVVFPVLFGFLRSAPHEQGIRALTLVLLLSATQPLWLIVFGVLFGLVDFATVAPTQLLASQYFKGHSVGLALLN
jgi:predicted MFS family arabinose efflux permease